MATSPSDQNNQNVLNWLDRLEDSVRTAGGSGGPGVFSLGSRGDAHGSADEDDEDDDTAAEERDDEPTERGSVGTVKVDEDETNQSLPDSAVPLGLIAELALTSTNKRGAKAKKAAAKDEEDADDDDVGVANDGYFLPGPANDLKIRAEIIEKDTPPEIVVHGLVTPDDVDKLFEIFFARLNCHVSVLDPVLHTPATTFKRCPFLFTVVCAVASRYYREKSEIYPIAMHFAKHAAANALITGWKSVELAQAYIILSIYGVPARRWEEDRGWLYTGLAIRIATDLNLHHFPTTKPADEMQEREVMNKVRVWINCYNLDRSTATQFGKPSTIKEDFIVRGSDDWYKMSQYNHPYDIGLCAYTSQLRIVAKFHEEVFSDPSSLTGLNEGLDYHEVTLRHDEALTRYFDEWTRRMGTESDGNDPACAFRASLLPFFTNYSRLVMYSFGCQQAFRRRDGIQESDRLFVDKCFAAAKEVITCIVDSLAPSGFMRYAPDSHFVFGTFASAFLLKLLKPEFLSHNFISKQQESEIFQLIHNLIQTLQSPEIAIDERHAPRLHARFLTGLLSRYKRDVATTGRLHTQPPPTQDQYNRVSQVMPGQQGQAAPQQQTFSTMPSGSSSDHGMGTSHSSPDSMLAEPVYEPETAYTAGAGPLDFDSAAMSGEGDVVGALRILNTPAYWSDMMTPGFQNQWGPQDTAYQQQSIHGIHRSFGTFRATGVV
ncbi:hypothetical protein PHLGIDRAFT_26729 [Phlebiopsis gigantea 11061_1 CR5-6]|uniref:Xylanolytic transcriptional activator regulatory domain-containing protein n=1 Tax=Phlebiopsis gigantea (strain 11061_1 CR5-6) TaxID=745531 RepID=A0A0C3PB17_PHLG1|nr:hypothetical protein PHLGIDRAFT_26729 [Phlebiopsis gigantea 11061_1 CR5-6]